MLPLTQDVVKCSKYMYVHKCADDEKGELQSSSDLKKIPGIWRSFAESVPAAIMVFNKTAARRGIKKLLQMTSRNTGREGET